MKHVLIVGATDGIGLALVRHYLASRWRVGMMGRDPDKLSRVGDQLRRSWTDVELAPVECDVANAERIAPAFEEALRSLGQLDLLIYCAGIMESGRSGIERAEAARRMFAVNTLGAVHFLELGADYMVAAGRGQLAAVGSVAGDRGRRGNPGYCSSKAGLHSYLEGLRHRLHGTGVAVATVKPGFVRTRMLDGADPHGTIEPAAAARKIARGLERGRDVFYVPGWWRAVALGLRAMPGALFKRIGPA